MFVFFFFFKLPTYLHKCARFVFFFFLEGEWGGEWGSGWGLC